MLQVKRGCLNRGLAAKGQSRSGERLSGTARFAVLDGSA